MKEELLKMAQECLSEEEVNNHHLKVILLLYSMDTNSYHNSTSYSIQS